MQEIEGNPWAESPCPICHKAPTSGKYVGSIGFFEAGHPWIDEKHKLCRLKRLPKDIFWIVATLICWLPVTILEKATGKEIV